MLQDLVGLHGPVPQVVAAVRGLPWDSDEELVTVGQAELIHVLTAYLNGALRPDEVEAWADAVEGRDDIAFTPGGVTDLIFELSTPDINGALTPEHAHALINRALSLPK